MVSIDKYRCGKTRQAQPYPEHGHKATTKHRVDYSSCNLAEIARAHITRGSLDQRNYREQRLHSESWQSFLVKFGFFHQQAISPTGSICLANRDRDGWGPGNPASGGAPADAGHSSHFTALPGLPVEVSKALAENSVVDQFQKLFYRSVE